MKEKATISDVANYAKVSKSTVSNFLNKKYERMTEETKKAITQAIEALDYVPSLSARRLSAKHSSKTICLVIPRNLVYLYDAMYYPTVFKAVGKIAEEKGYNILIFSRNTTSPNNEIEYLKSLAQSLVDGFIVFDLEKDDLYFKEFEKLNIPYICVGKILDYEDYPYVASDHKQSMKNMLKYLLDLGHKRIGVIAEHMSSVVEISRAKAFEEFLEENKNSAINSDYVHIPIKYSEKEILEKCQEMFLKEDYPSAVIVSSTFLNPCVQAIEKKGLRVPEDVSVIAFEYYESGKNNGYKNFTRVVSKADQISKIAFQKLIEHIEHPEEKISSHLEQLSLIEGETTRSLINNG